MELFTGLAIGIGLAAACGFRVFVPLLIVSIASASGHITLSPGFEWIGSYTAMTAFTVATIVEITAYYIPWVDNLLDSISTPAAVVAGTIMAGAFIGDIDPWLKWALAIIAGGGTAGTVQGITVLARGASSAVTGGLGNPVVSTTEAGGAVATAGLALLFPFLALFLVATGIGGLAYYFFFRKKQLPPPRLQLPAPDQS